MNSTTGGPSLGGMASILPSDMSPTQGIETNTAFRGHVAQTSNVASSAVSPSISDTFSPIPLSHLYDAFAAFYPRDCDTTNAFCLQTYQIL
jgi:hypothetical protein